MEAELKGGIAQLTVKFVSELISATRDKAGEVISGDPKRIREVTDIWTFAREAIRAIRIGSWSPPKPQISQSCDRKMRRLPDGGNALWFRALQSDAPLAPLAVAVAVAGFSAAGEANSLVKPEGGWKAKILKAKAKGGAVYQPVTFGGSAGLGTG